MQSDDQGANERSPLRERIRDELPRLAPRDAAELAGIVERLVQALRPERIYAFASHARGDASPDSDVDLAVLWRGQTSRRTVESSQPCAPSGCTSCRWTCSSSRRTSSTHTSRRPSW